MILLPYKPGTIIKTTNMKLEDQFLGGLFRDMISTRAPYLIDR